MRPLLLHVNDFFLSSVQRFSDARLNIALCNGCRPLRSGCSFDGLDPCVIDSASGDYKDGANTMPANEGQYVTQYTRHRREALERMEEWRIAYKPSVEKKATYVVRMSLKIQTPSSVWTADRAAWMAPYGTAREMSKAAIKS